MQKSLAPALLILYIPFQNAPVAQLDRASDYGSEGWEFESLRVYSFISKAGFS